MSLVLDNIPNQVSVLLKQVSNVELLCLITGEGKAQLEASFGGVVFKFLEEKTEKIKEKTIKNSEGKTTFWLKNKISKFY